MSIIAPTVNVSSGYYNNTMPQSYNRSSQEQRVIRALGNRGGRALARVMKALNGVAPGAAVNDSVVRITQPAAFSITALGGVRTVETLVRRSGVTTTGDRDYINNNIYNRTEPSNFIPYPRDLGGNGGGGKIQR